MKTNKMIKIEYILFGIMLIISCESGRKFELYKSFKHMSWGKDSIVNFQFETHDTLSKNNMVINIRNTDEYSYNNIFIITKLQYPNGYYIVDTLEYKMTDSKGRWLGKGYTDIKENELIYKENFIFPTQGKYQISIQQAMRKRTQIEGITNLKGISDVGFSVETVKK